MPRVRTRISCIIMTELAATDAKLLACAIMPNHLHLLLLQRSMTLGRVMQPILRRTALLVQRAHGVEGHVFSGRFYSGLCQTPDHLRETITYIHRNPVTAGLCGSVDDYEWTSHACYAGRNSDWSECCDWRTGLELFAEHADDGEAECRAGYLRWMARRLVEPQRTDVQLCLQGNRLFVSRFTATPPATFTGPDLRDVALKALSFCTTKYEMCELIGSYVSHEAAAVRRQIIAFLLLAGFRTGKIASFFGVAPGTVSKVGYLLKTARPRRLN